MASIWRLTLGKSFFKKNIVETSLLKIGWIGRIVDFKINILNRVIEDAFLYSEKYKKNTIFHIVASGKSTVSVGSEKVS